MPLINNKMKQSVGGNWGKPQDIEQHIKLKNFVVEPERVPSKKKPRKLKRNNIIEYHCCPFCHEELPIDKSLIGHPVLNRVNKCPGCGAEGDKECPACNKDTWFLNGFYKHQWMGCGFEGEKLKERKERKAKKMKQSWSHNAAKDTTLEHTQLKQQKEIKQERGYERY